MLQRVLIVDDSTMARMLIRRCVEIAGWPDVTFHEASNGKEALTLLGNEQVDLVLTDLNMPEMDGEQLLNVLRKDDKYSNLPLVVITSAGNAPKEEQLRQTGATAILAKPISPAVMATTLESIFGATDGM